jgi:hypothetical protein
MRTPSGQLGLKLIHWLMILILAAAVLVSFLQHSGIGLRAPESFGLAIAGTAPRP